MINLPEDILQIISRIDQNGFKAYAVGGCIRDILMGNSPHDYDITTNARPDQIKDIFKNENVIETGIKHGTVTVVYNGNPVEITTFRNESQYSDKRRPDFVAFTDDLFSDLSRRDFTMNAIAYSPFNNIADPFDGRNDIRQRRIRCCGNPYERLSEDPLRILRALRFSAVTGFDIDCDCAEAIHALKDLTLTVSGERISSELKKTVCGVNIERVITEFSDVFSVVIPELEACIGFDQNNPHHSFDLITHLSKTVAACPQDPIIRIAALLHDIAKPLTKTTDQNGISHYYSHAQAGAMISVEILKRLKFSKKQIDTISTLINHHDGVIEESERAVRRKVNRIGYENFIKLLYLQRADNASQSENVNFREEHHDALFRILNSVISNSECSDLKSLKINGYDLSDLGYHGKEIGNMLKILLDDVIEGRVQNDKDSLINRCLSLQSNKSNSNSAP